MRLFIFRMDTLASLSIRAFIAGHPFSEDDVSLMRQQYYGLLSCFEGLQISLQCAVYMSDRVCNLLVLFHARLKEIIDRFHGYQACDVRHCALFLDLEFSHLFRFLNSEFTGFYVSSLHSVLQDLEDCGYDYRGFRFSPRYDPTVSAHEFLRTVHLYPPVISVDLCDLVLEKTNRIVTACNETCYERQVYSGMYVDNLDIYYTARSCLRGFSRSISLDCTVNAYKLSIISKLHAILQTLRLNK